MIKWETLVKYAKTTDIPYPEIVARAIKQGWRMRPVNWKAGKGGNLYDITLVPPEGQQGFFRVVYDPKEPQSAYMTEYPETRKRILTA